MGTRGVGRGIAREIDREVMCGNICERDSVRKKGGESVNRRGVARKKGWGNMSER